MGTPPNSFSANTKIQSAQVNANFNAMSDGTGWSTSAITLGYAQITGNLTTTSASQVQATGLTSTVTIPAGGRKVKVSAYFWGVGSTVAATLTVFIWDGVIGSGTQLQGWNSTATASGVIAGACLIQAIVTPSAGSKTYNIGIATTGGTGTFYCGSTTPAFL